LKFINPTIKKPLGINISLHPHPLLKRGEAKDAGVIEHLEAK
jgi:hypothetical protein